MVERAIYAIMESTCPHCDRVLPVEVRIRGDMISRGFLLEASGSGYVDTKWPIVEVELEYDMRVLLEEIDLFKEQVVYWGKLDAAEREGGEEAKMKIVKEHKDLIKRLRAHDAAKEQEAEQ